MTNKTLTLSLVVPCYNEASNLKLLVPRCRKIVKNNSLEIIFVNNGSTDKTEHVPLRHPGPAAPRAQLV